MGDTLYIFIFIGLFNLSLQGQERRYACWGSFGPPVISAQCPRGTVIQVLRAGLKVRRGTSGVQCTYRDTDCGCEHGTPGCNMPNVRGLCMGRPACRLDVTQQYINTPACRGFSDYMFVDFNCVDMERTAVHDICVTDVAVSTTGFVRSPNYPLAYPKNRYCMCNLRTLPENSIKVSILDLKSKEKSDCVHSKLLLKHGEDTRLICDIASHETSEYDTGRAAISVVMETDDVETSGGFWLQYTAVPEATVQLECFGQFTKEVEANEHSIKLDEADRAQDLVPGSMLDESAAFTEVGRIEELNITLVSEPQDLDRANTASAVKNISGPGPSDLLDKNFQTPSVNTEDVTASGGDIITIDQATTVAPVSNDARTMNNEITKLKIESFAKNAEDTELGQEGVALALTEDREKATNMIQDLIRKIEEEDRDGDTTQETDDDVMNEIKIINAIESIPNLPNENDEDYMNVIDHNNLENFLLDERHDEPPLEFEKEERDFQRFASIEPSQRSSTYFGQLADTNNILEKDIVRFDAEKGRINMRNSSPERKFVRENENSESNQISIPIQRNVDIRTEKEPSDKDTKPWWWHIAAHNDNDNAVRLSTPQAARPRPRNRFPVQPQNENTNVPDRNRFRQRISNNMRSYDALKQRQKQMPNYFPDRPGQSNAQQYPVAPPIDPRLADGIRHDQPSSLLYPKGDGLMQDRLGNVDVFPTEKRGKFNHIRIPHPRPFPRKPIPYPPITVAKQLNPRNSTWVAGEKRYINQNRIIPQNKILDNRLRSLNKYPKPTSEHPKIVHAPKSPIVVSKTNNPINHDGDVKKRLRETSSLQEMGPVDKGKNLAVKTKQEDTATGKSALENPTDQPPDEQDSVMVTMIVAGVIGCILLLIVVGVLIRFAVKRADPLQTLQQQLHKKECVMRRNHRIQRNLTRGSKVAP